MAGASSNWYKVSGGPLKGQTVYVSKAQRAGKSRATAQGALNAGKAAWLTQANAQLPKGVAQSGRQAADAIKAAAKTAKTKQPRLSFASVDAAKAYALQSYRDWGVNLPDDQEKALDDYQGAGYEILNRILRTKGPSELPSHQREIAIGVEAAIHAAPRLRDAITVYRGVSAGLPAGKAFVDSLEVGKSYRDPGFMSTSLDPKVANDFNGVKGGVSFEIRLPKGQQAAYMQARPKSPGHMYEEQELVLPRDTRYKVVSKKLRATGNYHMVLEVY